MTRLRHEALPNLQYKDKIKRRIKTMTLILLVVAFAGGAYVQYALNIAKFVGLKTPKTT
jgi:hypothetical protein